jgi:GTP cyclohydrolase II
MALTSRNSFISMSDMKYNAVVASGIQIMTRVDIPEELIPADAKVWERRFCLPYYR